jgi:hypothetical protein
VWWWIEPVRGRVGICAAIGRRRRLRVAQRCGDWPGDQDRLCQSQVRPACRFAAAADFIFGGIKAAVAGGIDIGGTLHPIEIMTKDTQSDPNRAASVARGADQQRQG